VKKSLIALLTCAAMAAAAFCIPASASSPPSAHQVVATPHAGAPAVDVGISTAVKKETNDMSTTMRAKLQVATVKRGTGYEILEMNAVSKSGGYPADGTDEDNTYAKWSPSASFTIQVNNPALHGKFNPGDKFYVDFTPADPRTRS
jgi:hypothetical protein